MPTTAAPASNHSSTLPGDTPPDGMMFMAANGDTPSIDFRIFAVTWPAWKSLIIFAPLRCRSHSSLDDRPDGTASKPTRLHSGMKPRGLIGDSANLPPSPAISSRLHTVSSITVPTPIHTDAGSFSTNVFRTRRQSVESTVTSIALAPSSTSSIPRAIAASGFLARRIASTPQVLSVARVTSSGEAPPAAAPASASASWHGCPAWAFSIASKSTRVT
mmetsp:Transcript_27438/g.72066  ORF Transcript_27438/g.72066 Transcript_27438/m.72066 type:complete len:217 (+) Transcript_27438:195-845(+)